VVQHSAWIQRAPIPTLAIRHPTYVRRYVRRSGGIACAQEVPSPGEQRRPVQPSQGAEAACGCGGAKTPRAEMHISPAVHPSRRRATAMRRSGDYYWRGWAEREIIWGARGAVIGPGTSPSSAAEGDRVSKVWVTCAARQRRRNAAPTSKVWPRSTSGLTAMSLIRRHWALGNDRNGALSLSFATARPAAREAVDFRRAS
jgi:hypothetical protein